MSRSHYEPLRAAHAGLVALFHNPAADLHEILDQGRDRWPGNEASYYLTVAEVAIMHHAAQLAAMRDAGIVDSTEALQRIGLRLAGGDDE